MGTVSDAAAYIMDKAGPMSAMKLQKLCYFAYGYHLVWEDEKMFRQPFEAWANGPVSPALYSQHRRMYTLNKGDIVGDPSQLSDGQRESINIVLDAFGDFTAHQLSEMSHYAEGPWDLARRRAGASAMERSNEELSDTEIFEYFSRVVSAGTENN